MIYIDSTKHAVFPTTVGVFPAALKPKRHSKFPPTPVGVFPGASGTPFATSSLPYAGGGVSHTFRATGITA